MHFRLRGQFECKTIWWGTRRSLPGSKIESNGEPHWVSGHPIEWGNGLVRTWVGLRIWDMAADMSGRLNKRCRRDDKCRCFSAFRLVLDPWRHLFYEQILDKTAQGTYIDETSLKRSHKFVFFFSFAVFSQIFLAMQKYYRKYLWYFLRSAKNTSKYYGGKCKKNLWLL